MKLTALEIKQQTFEKSLRGYDPAEVQAFLSLVSNEWEHLIGKINDLEDQIDKLNEKLKHYERVEEALHETLQTAKDSAEQKLGGAKREAQNILEKAEMEADSIVREANQQRQQIRQSILRLIERRQEIVGGIRSYLEIAHESIQHFSKDEADIYKLPKGENAGEPALSEVEPKLASGFEYNEREKSKEHKHAKKDEPPTPPGTEEMDDILDEID